MLFAPSTGSVFLFLQCGRWEIAGSGCRRGAGALLGMDTWNWLVVEVHEDWPIHILFRDVQIDFGLYMTIYDYIYIYIHIYICVLYIYMCIIYIYIYVYYIYIIDTHTHTKFLALPQNLWNLWLVPSSWDCLKTTGVSQHVDHIGASCAAALHFICSK